MQSFCVTPLDGPLALVCHDAGAANLALAWVESLQQSAELACRAVLQGPARTLVSSFELDLQFVDSVPAALDSAQVLLSGTGWASRLEHEARLQARNAGVHSIAVVDHWVNYRERFVRDGLAVLPDELWVADADAFAIAREQLPEVGLVRQQPNLYLAKQLHGIAPVPQQPEVLYLLEPARSDWGLQEAGEFQALNYFMAHRARAGVPAAAVVRLRPHPSDPAGKYDAWLQRHAGRAVLAPNAPLAQDLSRASWVAGCETAALAVALAAGRRTVCTLPPWAPPCRLPQQGLIHLQRLVPSTK